MRQASADSGYWIAVLNPRDSLHRRAVEVSRSLGPIQILTSEFIQIEVFNHFSGGGHELRETVHQWAAKLERSSNVRVIPASTELHADAKALYGARLDKAWSLVDCSSKIIMVALGIVDALSHDQHFIQMGFNPLLRKADA